MGNYILDLYCPQLKLCIEIDGSTFHDPAVDIDRARWLAEKGISVSRIQADKPLSVEQIENLIKIAIAEREEHERLYARAYGKPEPGPIK